MSVLKVHLTYHCSAACDHCRFGCTPTSSALIDVAMVIDTARALQRSNGLDLVVLLGGEPGLYPAVTHALTTAMRGMGLQVRIETNASWATDDGRALAFLEPLYHKGVSVMFSLDAFHEPHVPPERVVRALRLSEALGGTHNIESAYLRGPGSTHPLDVRTDTLLARWSGETRIYRGPVLFVGRAAARLAPLVAAGRGIPVEPCPAVPWWPHGEQDTLDLLILDPQGNLSKGCGISLGNVHCQTVEAILAGYDAIAHPLIGRLIERGPLALAEEAMRHGLYALKADYADRCHLCQEARAALRPLYSDWLTPDQHYGTWAPAPEEAGV
jgi:hypothetical protein